MKIPKINSLQQVMGVTGLLGIVTFTAMTVYWFSPPEQQAFGGSNDLRCNGMWLQHGWMATDEWLLRNHKNVSEFRDSEKIAKLASELNQNHIRDVFPHMCPCLPSGIISDCDSQQVERFLDSFKDFRVMPWVGGVNESDVFLSKKDWREQFCKSCATLLQRHPRLSGIHLNVEPIYSGNKSFLLLLEDLRKALPPNKIISIAAYPPPTFWQPSTEVHWDERYTKLVAARVDQAVIMMYDTSLHSQRIYQALLKDWTVDVLSWYGSKSVLLGVPAYDGNGEWYHDPRTENLTTSLSGIQAASPSSHKNYQGVSVYAEWTMSPAKWQTFRTLFSSGTAAK